MFYMDSSVNSSGSVWWVLNPILNSIQEGIDFLKTFPNGKFFYKAHMPTAVVLDPPY
jgi:hypothetical protein